MWPRQKKVNQCCVVEAAKSRNTTAKMKPQGYVFPRENARRVFINCGLVLQVVLEDADQHEDHKDYDETRRLILHLVFLNFNTTNSYNIENIL